MLLDCHFQIPQSDSFYINIYAKLSQTIWTHENLVKIEVHSLRNVYAENGVIFVTFSDTFHVGTCTLEINYIFFLHWMLLFILKTRFAFPACALRGENRIEKRERMGVEKKSSFNTTHEPKSDTNRTRRLALLYVHIECIHVVYIISLLKFFIYILIGVIAIVIAVCVCVCFMLMCVFILFWILCAFFSS